MTRSQDREAHDRESHTRSLIKALTWRTIGTIDTILISWLLTGQLVIAIHIGAVELVTKTVLYYIHERTWQLLPRGAVRQWRRQWRRRIAARVPANTGEHSLTPAKETLNG